MLQKNDSPLRQGYLRSLLTLRNFFLLSICVGGLIVLIDDIKSGSRFVTAVTVNLKDQPYTFWFVILFSCAGALSLLYIVFFIPSPRRQAPDSMIRDVIAFTLPVEAYKKFMNEGGQLEVSSKFVLERSHLKIAISKRILNQITASELTEWASFVETSNDVIYSEEDADVIDDTVFSLANPVTQGELSFDQCSKLLRDLD